MRNKKLMDSRLVATTIASGIAAVIGLRLFES